IGIPGKVIGEYLTEQRVITCKSDLYATLFLLPPGERDADLEALLTSFLEFEEYYLRDARLANVLPRLVTRTPERYQGYTIRQHSQEMHEYYAKNEIYKL